MLVKCVTINTYILLSLGRSLKVPSGIVFILLNDNILKKKIQHLNNTNYKNRQASANSIDPHQMPQNVASDQGRQYLLFMLRF